MTIARSAPAEPHPIDAGAELLGEIGSLQARLAKNADEVRAAQRLRYEVFTREFAAAIGDTGIDEDHYDALCDHLIVLDTRLKGSGAEQIVGTYRLLPQNRTSPDLPFYSDAAYDVGALIVRHPDRRFLELGRSCVLPAYRSKRTIELLWQGIWAYCRRNSLDVMFGCASFPGVQPAAHAAALAFLHHHALTMDGWTVSARAEARIDMDFMPLEAIDLRAAMRALPPLVKGYLRLGARFGDGAVIDPAFSSIDVLVVLPIEQISVRYVTYYGAEAERFAA